MTNFVKSYYKGGHRVMMGNVPCRVSRLPKHEGGKALMAQSSREMCLPLPPRGRKDRAEWDARHQACYDAMEKLGDRSIAAVVSCLPRDPVPVEPAPVEVVEIAKVTEPARVTYRPPSRPARRVSAMPGSMRTIHYLRVSDAKQGRSGLGLEAQRAALEAFCAGRNCETLAEYVEVESGKHDDRPELLKALHHAKVTGATVAIAKLDRLSRNVAFLAQLQDAGVAFVCADMPEANEMTIGIMAVMAQAERKAISKRTSEALAAVKARGIKLGNPMGAAAFGDRAIAGRMMAASVNRKKADSFARDIRPIIDAIRADGHTSLRQIAAELDARGIMTARRGSWSTSMVRSVIERSGDG